MTGTAVHMSNHSGLIKHLCTCRGSHLNCNASTVHANCRRMTSLSSLSMTTYFKPVQRWYRAIKHDQTHVLRRPIPHAQVTRILGNNCQHVNMQCRQYQYRPHAHHIMWSRQCMHDARQLQHEVWPAARQEQWTQTASRKSTVSMDFRVYRIVAACSILWSCTCGWTYAELHDS